MRAQGRENSGVTGVMRVIRIGSKRGESSEEEGLYELEIPLVC